VIGCARQWRSWPNYSPADHLKPAQPPALVEELAPFNELEQVATRLRRKLRSLQAGCLIDSATRGSATYRAATYG